MKIVSLNIHLAPRNYEIIVRQALRICNLQQNGSIIQNIFSAVRTFVTWICLGIIKGYRYLISPLLPPSCRFTPTCSCYAAEAITSHGPIKGIFFALARIVRCNPFCEGGYDPVPPVKGG